MGLRMRGRRCSSSWPVSRSATAATSKGSRSPLGSMPPRSPGCVKTGCWRRRVTPRSRSVPSSHTTKSAATRSPGSCCRTEGRLRRSGWSELRAGPSRPHDSRVRFCWRSRTPPLLRCGTGSPSSRRHSTPSSTQVMGPAGATFLAKPCSHSRIPAQCSGTRGPNSSPLTPPAWDGSPAWSTSGLARTTASWTSSPSSRSSRCCSKTKLHGGPASTPNVSYEFGCADTSSPILPLVDRAGPRVGRGASRDRAGSARRSGSGPARRGRSGGRP